MVDSDVQRAYDQVKFTLFDKSGGLIPKIESERWRKIKVRDVLSGFENVDENLTMLFKEVEKVWVKVEAEAKRTRKVLSLKGTRNTLAEVEVRIKGIRNALEQSKKIVERYDVSQPYSYMKDVALVNTKHQPEELFPAAAHWTRNHFPYIYTALQQANLIKRE
ncbi:hypothetical protein HYX14_05175 [Candidatus Woesearchaeota archaeon]|nr:hypothetical protein [Candidatus Woesearchaeota archaeon]